MECIDLYQAGDPNVHLIRETGSKRTFWRDLGVVIGASDGEETTFVFVEWTASGTVHGRPISAAELRRKGA